jgi:peptidoglycan hydrolase-like protein with peptidoglycan-binding domain
LVLSVTRPRRRRLLWVSLTLLLALVCGAAGWASALVFLPRADVPRAAPFTYVEVSSGVVESSIDLNTVAEWKPVPAGINQASGIVTSVHVAPGSEATQGSALYSVDLRPVAVAAGDVPAFRSLELGAKGRDVEQLQAMLIELNHMHPPADGTFGSQTARAVSAWQKQLGIEATGSVGMGDLIFLSKLPSQVSLEVENIFVGNTLAGGERAVNALANSPIFEVPITEAQSSLIPRGSEVEISAEGQVWNALVEDRSSDEVEGIRLQLAGLDSSPICGTACDLVPVTGATLFRSKVAIVQPTEGAVVPSAALLSDASGQLTVVDERGESHDVRVVASARGMSVIEGVKTGTRVRIPASE